MRLLSDLLEVEDQIAVVVLAGRFLAGRGGGPDRAKLTVLDGHLDQVGVQLAPSRPHRPLPAWKDSSIVQRRPATVTKVCSGTGAGA